VPEKQKEAIAFASKVPLVYISIAVRNWQAFANLGYHSISIPKPDLMHSFVMDFPVSMGGYSYTQSPDQPTVIHGTLCRLIRMKACRRASSTRAAGANCMR
jgi:spermidine dehydrogenase